MKTISAEAGMHIGQAIEYAKFEASQSGLPYAVKLVFNGVNLTVLHNSQLADIAEIYRLKRKCGEYEK